MSNHDALENVSGKKSLYRIYKDVRFSKDKSPQTSICSRFTKSNSLKRGGYYLNIQPGNNFIACGFLSNSDDLKEFERY
jgi:uncharacterized protein (DUF2461 family)